jgi:Flp pilus assembly protein TadD
MTQMLPLMVGVQARKRRIDTLERQGRYASAHEEYLRLLALERSAKTLSRAATNLAQLGNYVEATAFAREAIALDPKDANIQYTLALVLYTGLEKELARTPGFPATASVCREVVTTAQRAVELKSDHARAYLMWGLALKQLGDLKAAEEQIRKGLSFRPDDLEILIRLGQLLVKAGNTSGAIAVFEEAKKLKPTDLRAARELEQLRGK